MEDRTEKALRWMVGIFNSLYIEYQIVGGFAAKVFGSQRSLNDIDFEIHDKDFAKLIPFISNRVKFGPARFKDDKWDCYLVTLDYFGQEIDISGADTTRISSKDRTRWIEYQPSKFNFLVKNIYGMGLNIINPTELIEYKSELDGEHQLIDIHAVNEYLKKMEYK